MILVAFVPILPKPRVHCLTHRNFVDHPYICPSPSILGLVSPMPSPSLIPHCASQMVDGAVITYLIGNKTEHYLDLVDSLSSLHIHYLARLPYPVVRLMPCRATLYSPPRPHSNRLPSMLPCCLRARFSSTPLSGASSTAWFALTVVSSCLTATLL